MIRPSLYIFDFGRGKLLREIAEFIDTCESLHLLKVCVKTVRLCVRCLFIFVYFQIILPVIYCSIVYFMTSQPNDGSRYAQYVAITILTCLVSQSIGLLLGAVAPNVPVSIDI